MNKKLIFSDLHLGLYKSSKLWLEISKQFIREIRSYCVRNEISEIICLGDFFTNRKSLNIYTFLTALEIADIIYPEKMIIIPGNHDLFHDDRIEPTFLDIFKNHDNIEVIKEPTKRDNIFFVPWVNRDIDMPRGEVYIMGHFPIKGFKTNNYIDCKNGLEAEKFRLYKHIYSGHFHFPSTKGNITYLGSPFQQNWHDVNSRRGYYVFNDGDLEFIEFTNVPKFVEVHTEDNLSEEEITGNIVKIIYDRNYGTHENNKKIREVENLRPLKVVTDCSNFFTIQQVDEIREEDHRALLYDPEEIMKSYINQYKVPSNISKVTLSRMIRNMIDEVVEI